MPTVHIEENIQKLRMNIDKMTQEIFRLQGMIQIFEDFKKNGLTIINLPEKPDEKPYEAERKRRMAEAGNLDLGPFGTDNPSMLETMMSGMSPSVVEKAMSAMANANQTAKENESIQEKPE
jgi:hypothetical protein